MAQAPCWRGIQRRWPAIGRASGRGSAVMGPPYAVLRRRRSVASAQMCTTEVLVWAPNADRAGRHAPRGARRATLAQSVAPVPRRHEPRASRPGGLRDVSRGSHRTGRHHRTGRRRRAAHPELPTGQLVRLSLYWLGLSCVFIGLTNILGGRILFEGLGDETMKATTLFILGFMGTIIAVIVQPTIGSISDYTDQPLGPPQAVHLHRQHPRHRLPAGHRDLQHRARDRGVHGAPAVQRQLRPGPVPGVHPGPRAREAGGHRVGAGRAVPGPGQRRRVRDRRDRRRHEQLLARHDGAGRPGVRDHARRSSSGCDEGRTPEGARRPQLAIHRRARPGAPTS